MSTILIVCTGNICRSPMAEGMLRRLLSDRGIEGVDVGSAGVSGWDGAPATPEAIEALAEKDIDISGHQARRLTHRMIAAADLIVAMAAEHRDGVVLVSPAAASRTFTLKELVNLLDHHHPLRSDQDPGERIREAVEAADGVRRSGTGGDLLDEDVADPLGLSLPAFQAAAWELGELSQRLVDRLFGGSEAGSQDAGLDGRGARTDPARQRFERLGTPSTDDPLAAEREPTTKGDLS